MGEIPIKPIKATLISSTCYLSTVIHHILPISAYPYQQLIISKLPNTTSQYNYILVITRTARERDTDQTKQATLVSSTCYLQTNLQTNLQTKQESHIVQQSLLLAYHHTSNFTNICLPLSTIVYF